MEKIRVKHWHIINILLIIYDLISVNAAYFLALWIRFDCRFNSIPAYYLQTYIRFIPIYSIVCLIIFTVFKLYKSIWRFAGYRELFNIIFASVTSSILHVIGITFIFRRMTIVYYVFGAFIQLILVAAVRFSYRFYLTEKKRMYVNRSDDPNKNVMVIGAGSAGNSILKDIKSSNELHDKVVCIIDDKRNKWGRYIDGVPVVGGTDSIQENVEKYNVSKIYIAIPSMKPADKKNLIDICKETGCEIKNLPGIYQFVTGEIGVSALKEVSVEDLLGRDPIRVNTDEILEQLRGKVVMVTGGGGSIGSELCRQIAEHEPEQLIIFDIYENNAYEIELELKEKHPDLNLVTLIGSVRDSRRLDQVFSEYHPEVIYHAAAHKHVPLMEDSPCEAVKNNAIGTYKTAYGAMLYGVKKFVLISTDKAVNPTNVMGASKRMCEMIVQSFDRLIKEGRADEIPEFHTHADDYAKESIKKIPKDTCTEFVAVRFGNVLGSNGSVIPIFKKQIAKGGPVTVTHPDIIRYFMTIPEAVSLVLQASYYAKGGEIFILDMGEPVKIDTLARNLIKLSGHKPDEDIMIEYTGLRPGEKLFEEKLMAEEGMQTTPNKLIHIGMPIEFDVEKFYQDLRDAMMVAYNDDEAGTKKWVMKIVDTYHPADN
ncbi:MAG: polysaccharide biosynthesis protein [Parasporobacterium sp.]|nr:polysaccharide biosynthesis protein [Parasporobacterium sp.]